MNIELFEGHLSHTSYRILALRLSCLGNQDAEVAK